MEHVLKQHMHHTLGETSLRGDEDDEVAEGIEEEEREDKLQVHSKERLTPAACKSVFEAGRCIEAFQTPAPNSPGTRSNSKSRALKLESSSSRHIHQEPHISMALGLIGPSEIHGSNPFGSKCNCSRGSAFGRAGAPSPRKHDRE